VAGHVSGRGGAVRLAEAIVTRAPNRGRPDYRDITLDVGGIFIDSLRHAESFRVVRRPGSQLLEVAEDGMPVLARPADRPVQWRGACGCKSERARADVTD